MILLMPLLLLKHQLDRICVLFQQSQNQHSLLELQVAHDYYVYLNERIVQKDQKN